MGDKGSKDIGKKEHQKKASFPPERRFSTRADRSHGGEGQTCKGIQRYPLVDRRRAKLLSFAAWRPRSRCTEIAWTPSHFDRGTVEMILILAVVYQQPRMSSTSGAKLFSSALRSPPFCWRCSTGERSCLPEY